MSIPVELVPQADDMDKILETVEVVSHGHRTFEEIADYIGLVGRQGRYYRKATEILGFTKRSGANYSVLTKLGKEFLEASGLEKRVILQEALLKNPVFIEVVNRLRAAGNNGLGDDDIEDAIISITQTTAGMANRRRASVKSWLKYIKIARQIGSKICLTKKIPGPAVIQIVDDPSAQILRPTKKLKIFTPREVSDTQIKEKLKSVEYTFDEAKKEKADKTHKSLVYMMAEKIFEAGGNPKESSHSIDLATKINDKEFIFEMKSITGKSIHGQIRRGIAQLYEYGYLHNMPDAILCLVLEKKPTGKKAWLTDYLVKDRGIMVCWKSNSNFDCPAKCKTALGRFL
jgi:hypothetical protein